MSTWIKCSEKVLHHFQIYWPNLPFFKHVQIKPPIACANWWWNYVAMRYIACKWINPNPTSQCSTISRHTADYNVFLIARFMGRTWGPSGANRTQVCPMLAPRTFAIWVSIYMDFIFMVSIDESKPFWYICLLWIKENNNYEILKYKINFNLNVWVDSIIPNMQRRYILHVDFASAMPVDVLLLDTPGGDWSGNEHVPYTLHIFLLLLAMWSHGGNHINAGKCILFTEGVFNSQLETWTS